MFRAALLLAFLPAVAHCAAPPPKVVRVPLLVDTDIGFAMDDAFALAWLLADRRADVRAITTVHEDAYTRALIVCRMLHAIGRSDISVASGARPRAVPDHSGAMQYGLRPAHRRPTKEDAVELLYRRLKERPREYTIVCLGPLTNIAAMIDRYPDSLHLIGRLVVMGGALKVGYKGKPPAVAEWNFESDPKAAQRVLHSGLSMLLVPLDVTWDLKLETKTLRNILDRRTPLANQLAAIESLTGDGDPVLFDALAALASVEKRGLTISAMNLTVDEKGMVQTRKARPNIDVVTAIDRAAVRRRLAEPLTGRADPEVKLKLTNVTTPIDRGAMPSRVHVVEDYTTDIERRWWLAGKLNEKSRVCRGVLTDDFDDRMGDKRALYTGVIFNPVPGPPMGKKPRLSFRCWLDTGTLRVQLYTLSKGYHRHLTLTNLPKEEWLELTVDMTQARRPDGSGGPLAEDERIDDIQFYADRGARLRIRDIVLYDAAARGERRPFPARILFTGWFDTGRQPQEWPGVFDILPHAEPLTWKYARSVEDVETKSPWVRVGLRGSRPIVGKKVEVRFRYHLNQEGGIRVEGVDGKRVERGGIVEAVRGRWTEATVTLSGMKKIEEVRFRAPPGTTLGIDDVVVYEPAP